MEEKKLYELVDAAVACLTEEQKKKVKNCENLYDLIDLLGESGVALPDELLNYVSGGAVRQPGPGYVAYTAVCPSCGQSYTFTKLWAYPGKNITKPPEHPNCVGIIRE